MKNYHCTARSHRGFSLVELMVAMVVGLIILGTVSAIMVNANKNYTATDSTARLQENARFAMHFITTDLRRAGYFGCTDDISVLKSTLNGSGGAGGLALNALEGVEAVGTGLWQPSTVSTSFTSPVLGSDAFAIRYLDLDNPITIQQEMPNESAVLFVNTGHGLKANDIIAVTDCDSADIMQLTNVNASGSSGKDNLVHNAGSGTPGNSTQKLSKSYGADATVLKFNSAQYYISTSVSGLTTSLYRITTTGTQELVEGVENMQIRYGVVTTADRVPSSYVTADSVGIANWGNVISVRIGLLLSSVANTANGQSGQDVDTKIHDVNGTNIGPIGDRRIRKVFVSTVMLRNIK